MKHVIYIVTGLLLVAGLSAVVIAADTAQTAGTEAYVQPDAAHWHEIDTDWMKSFHKPAEGVEMGLDLRLREVYARNIFSLNEDYGGDENWNNLHWQRYRMRLAAKLLLDKDIDFNTRLTWEFWGHCAPDTGSHPISGNFFGEKNYDFDEAIFDTMNIQFRNAFSEPLTLTVGRQDIILGTGWLVLDGTPGDGSRTIFFDAVRGAYEIDPATKLDLIYIQQYDSESKWLKPINYAASRDRRHLTQKSDEKGFIAYLTNKTDEGQQREVYYIYKSDEDSDWGNAHSSTPGQSADIHTLGGRLAGPFDDNWSYSAEGAAQMGDRESETLRAFGANTKLMYAFKDVPQNEVHVGYEYLSGDDPDTSRDEEFDSLWGDWPQSQRGNDLQSYIWAFEGDGLGNVTNLHRVGVGHSFKPCDMWTVASDYNLLYADENTYADSSTGPAGALNYSNSGKFRGHMLSGIATYQCCKKFKTHFMLDYFMPGHYYDEPSQDDAFFARVNLEWTF